MKHIFFYSLAEAMNAASRSSKIKDEDMTEYNALKVTYRESITNTEDFEVTMSDPFYNTWMHRTFHEIFNGRYRRDKAEATMMNELYRALNDNRNNEEFLKNYNTYS